jgi:hypothetical protein
VSEIDTLDEARAERDRYRLAWTSARNGRAAWREGYSHTATYRVSEYAAKVVTAAKAHMRRADQAEARLAAVREAIATRTCAALYPDYDGGYQSALEDILEVLEATP